MNWTGGRLQRHSKKSKGTSTVDKQRAYFAKARTKLQNGPSHASTFSPSFLQVDQGSQRRISQPSISQPPRRQQLLEEFEDVDPVVQRVNSIAIANRLQHTSPSLVHVQSTRSHHSQNQAPDKTLFSAYPVAVENQSVISQSRSVPKSVNQIRRSALGSLPSKASSNISHAPIESLQEAELREKRKELLIRRDWVGLDPSRPVDMDFVSNRGNERIGKRRKINDQDHLRRAALAGRTRVASVDEQYMMSGALLKPYDRIEDVLKIKIGEDALLSQSAMQSSHFPETVASQVDSSESVMLEDEERSKAKEHFILLEDDENLLEVGLPGETRANTKEVGRAAEVLSSGYFVTGEHIYWKPSLVPVQTSGSGAGRTSFVNDVRTLNNEVENASKPEEKYRRTRTIPPHTEEKFFVFPSSESKSIDSLLEELSSGRVTAGTTKLGDRPLEQHHPRDLADDITTEIDDRLWRRLTNVPTHSTMGETSIDTKQDGDMSDGKSDISWNGFPSSTGATASVLETSNIEMLQQTDGKPLNPNSSNPEMQLSDHIEEHEETPHPDPPHTLQHIPRNEPETSPPLPAKVAAPAALPPTKTPQRSKPQDTDDLWRNWVCLSSSNPNSPVPTTDPLPNPHRTHPQAPAPPQNSSLNANASSSTSDPDHLSPLSPSTSSPPKTTAATGSSTTRGPSSTAAQYTRSRSPFEVGVASLASGSSEDPLTRDHGQDRAQLMRGGAGLGDKQKQKPRKKEEQRILFRPPRPFRGVPRDGVREMGEEEEVVVLGRKRSAKGG